MTLKDLLDILKRVTYKRGWKFRIQDNYGYEGLLCLRVEFLAECAVTGAKEVQVCSQHTIDPEHIVDERAFMLRLLSLVKQAEDHEAREFLKLDGVATFDPHK